MDGKPSYTYKELYIEALRASKGIRWHDVTRSAILESRDPNYNKCYLCGRQSDYLYQYIHLTTIYLPGYTPPFKNICQYCIAKVSNLVDCQTGEVVKGTYINPHLLPLLDVWHWVTLQLSYAIRFIYYYIYWCIIVYLIDKYNLTWAIKLGRKLRIWG